jgi:hypothetical protein
MLFLFIVLTFIVTVVLIYWFEARHRQGHNSSRSPGLLTHLPSAWEQSLPKGGSISATDRSTNSEQSRWIPAGVKAGRIALMQTSSLAMALNLGNAAINPGSFGDNQCAEVGVLGTPNL